MNNLTKLGLAGIVGLGAACTDPGPKSIVITDLRATPSIVDAGQQFTVEGLVRGIGCKPSVVVQYGSQFDQQNIGRNDVAINTQFIAKESGYIRVLADCSTHQINQDSTYITVR